ncbi:MAG: class I SAM-dependent RNA methyltransferase [Caulobacter sp.]|nr:class I SAM-dependent RNA methyltransferase [Vitreoscilla sp.]
MNEKPDFLFVTCANGSEDLLAEECIRILGPKQGVVAGRGGVMVNESVENAMRLNLRSRIAQRVLWPMVDGDYRNENDLYDLGRRINWSEWITPDETIRVDVTAQRSPLTSLNFAALRIKDAVCDVMREQAGARPSVDTRFPDLAISLHVDPTHAWIAIDLSGEALFKRGWRELQGEAPLKETRASPLIYAAGWQGRPEDGGLLDPTCGAGTIAIEAAQIACNIAPGLTRRFAFERLRPFLEYSKLWGEMQVEARDTIVKPAVPIWAGDVSFRMTDFATRNAERAGVAHAIDFKTADALQRLAPADRGTIVMNPPYGERIDAKGRGSQGADGPRAPRTFQSGGGRESAVVGDGAATEFFSQLATHWKRNYSGWTAWILSPDMKLPTAMRLKESRRVPMWNGPIECRLFRFDMVSGSARGGAQPPVTSGN